MIDKNRLEESFELIRRHLVKFHTDKDVNSLSVRFSEIMHHIEDQEFRIKAMNSVFEKIVKHK